MHPALRSRTPRSGRAAARRRAAAVFLAVAAVLLAGLTLPAATPRASAASCGTTNPREQDGLGVVLGERGVLPRVGGSGRERGDPVVQRGRRSAVAGGGPGLQPGDLPGRAAVGSCRRDAFQIQVSPDGSAWTLIYSTTTGTGGTQTLNVSGTGRYIRMYGTARATGYGYSLWEFGVYTGGSGFRRGRRGLLRDHRRSG